MRLGVARGRLASILALLSALAIPHSLALERPVIGRLTDGDGVVIAGAVIYVSAVVCHHRLACGPMHNGSGPLPAKIPTTIVHSDLDGAFYAQLPAGRYRVAALKSGYDVAMTEIHTLVRGFLHLEMVESASIRLGNRPVGSAGGNLGIDWILRQRGDVLRQERPALAASSPASPEAGRIAALFAPIEGRFVQELGGAAPFGGSGTSDRLTGLSLRRAIGKKGLWRFDGSAARAFADVDGDTGRLEERNDRLAVGLDYALSDRDNLSGDLWYGTRSYAIDAALGSHDGTDQEQRTLGFRSRWERIVGPGASFHLSGGYFETGVNLPDPARSPLNGLDTGFASADQLTNRAWLASAGFAFEEGNHQIGVGNKVILVLNSQDS